MKRALLILLALALLPGCSYILPANQPPKAYINAITPSTVVEGEMVTMSGYGTDVDGQVVAYRWRSSKDGQLGVTPEFNTNSLSVGNHVIYFSVQDNNDVWSAEVSGSVNVLAASSQAIQINSFTASPSSVLQGENVTLSWVVSNATSVSIDQGIGTVSATGSTMVTLDETTTFKLTATGGTSTVHASITVTVQEPARRVTITADTEMTGFVRSLGIYVPGGVYVGDDSSDRGIQGFVTFDISRIPNNATITRVTLDLSRYEVPHGAPLPQLGCLSAFSHTYSTLYGQYWTGDVPLPLQEWCDFADLDTPVESVRMRNALQGKLNTNLFQLRLQFADRETDGDARNDLLYWPDGSLPRLIVEYQ